jgi:hypothetical protein
VNAKNGTATDEVVKDQANSWTADECDKFCTQI